MYAFTHIYLHTNTYNIHTYKSMNSSFNDYANSKAFYTFPCDVGGWCIIIIIIRKHYRILELLETNYINSIYNRKIKR